MTTATLDAEQREFQQYARRWLAENAPPPPPERLPVLPIEVMSEPLREYLRDWQRRCYDAALIGADIPVAYGGRGHSGFQRIANREMARAGTPFMLNAWECDVHIYFKRSLHNQALYGDGAYQRRILAERLIGPIGGAE